MTFCAKVLPYRSSLSDISGGRVNWGFPGSSGWWTHVESVGFGKWQYA